MIHPQISQITAIAEPIAETLGLEIVAATFHTNQYPPILRVDIRNRQQDTSLDDCERMSRSLEATLDSTNVIPEAYILEISSPGISRFLTTDRDFSSFKGFTVIVKTAEPHKNRQEWTGQLMYRNEEAVYLNQKGRAIAIPRSLVTEVRFAER